MSDLYKQSIVATMSDLYKQSIVATMSDLCADKLRRGFRVRSDAEAGRGREGTNHTVHCEGARSYTQHNKLN
jgi:hypothetical protein